MNLIRETITLPTLYSVPADSETARNELLSRARENTTITTSAEQNSAVECARHIRAALKDVEDTRTTLKKPLLDAGRQVDALAKDFVAPLTSELNRIERLVTNFQQAEQRRVAEEEAKRRAEIERLERERVAREVAARKAAEAITNEAELAAAIKVEEEARAAAEQQQAVIRAPLPEAAMAGGTSTRKVMRWEVTDLRALYAARPELCTIEAKASAINATCVPEMPVPGLKMWWEDKTTIRRF